MSSAIKGYAHGNRGNGIRNHQLILPSVICSTHVSRRIATEIDAVTFAHQHGCAIIGDDVAGIDNFFIQLADHPNVNSALVIGLGCETIQGQELAAKLLERNQSTQYRIIQESGGVEGTVEAGVKAARELNTSFVPVPAEITTLHVGIDNGREYPGMTNLRGLLEAAGHTVIISDSPFSSAESFSRLAQEKAHIVISFPSETQPPSGFPLFPVINVASSSVLHQAIRADFDIAESQVEADITALIESVANGTHTIAEKNKSGEIRAPRVVRSV
jgi:altronate dehydratase large subunit